MLKKILNKDDKSSDDISADDNMKIERSVSNENNEDIFSFGKLKLYNNLNNEENKSKIGYLDKNSKLNSK